LVRHCYAQFIRHHGRAISAALSSRARLLNAIALLFVISFALTAAAQKEIITIPSWRVQQGDNPDWAKPDFNDSTWPQATYFSLTRTDYTGGTHWYRATFSVPADFQQRELAIGMGPLDEVYDVYVEGILVGRFGSWAPAPHAPFPRHLTVPLLPGLFKTPIGHIAIRRWTSTTGLRWVVFSGSGYMSYPHPPQIGSRVPIEALEQLHPAAGAIQQLPWILTYVLFLAAATISLVLFSAHRRNIELLYLGFYCICVAVPPLIAIPLTTSTAVMSRSWALILIFFFANLCEALSLLFLASLCQRFRKPLLVGAAIATVFALASAYGFGSQSESALLVWTYGTNYVTPLFVILAMWGLFRSRSRGSFAIASSLLLASAAWAWGVVRLELHLPSPTVDAGPFRIDIRSLPGVIFVFVTLFVLYLRYRDERARQEAVDQDLAAARRMQEQLLSCTSNEPKGFTIDAIYSPALEVGGDFYRTVCLEDGSLLAIVGDVSGKGLDAAMLVAVVLGSLANETHRSPASLLAYLNNAVMGRTAGGFITACCARFYLDGRVVLANAGQISPYIDGRELQLDNGLPLGISPEAVYSESEIYADGPVTFVSDGVVEAIDHKGELLGFDRTATLSSKSAAEIAEAAQRWGQKDDITVLKITTQPTAATHSAFTHQPEISNAPA
jgi:phosphoserine phosphatase RsbU/P